MKKLILIIFLISTSFVFAQSKLPKCQGSDVKKYNNCFGEYLFSQKTKYIGEFVNGLPHGKGIFMKENGDKYVGEYKNGLRDGKGTYTYRDGEKYDR